MPGGASVARFQIDAASNADDLDLYVYRGEQLVSAAVSSTADEVITLEKPPPGVYRVFVSSAASGLEDARGVLDRHLPRRMRVSPEPVTVTGGRPFGIAARWQRLDSERAWFGYIAYDGSSTRTYVTLD